MIATLFISSSFRHYILQADLRHCFRLAILTVITTTSSIEGKAPLQHVFWRWIAVRGSAKDSSASESVDLYPMAHTLLNISLLYLQQKNVGTFYCAGFIEPIFFCCCLLQMYPPLCLLFCCCLLSKCVSSENDHFFFTAFSKAAPHRILFQTFPFPVTASVYCILPHPHPSSPWFEKLFHFLGSNASVATLSPWFLPYSSSLSSSI